MIKGTIILFFLISFPQSAFSEHLINPDKALIKIYKEATRFEEVEISLTESQVQWIEDAAGLMFSREDLNKLRMTRVFKHDLLIGYAFEDTVLGRWGPIHYLTGFDKNGIILQTIILDYDEIRGKPISKRRFLNQYKGKSVKNPIKIRKDIDGVTGATISSRSLTDGIRKIVHILYLLNNESN